MASGKKAKKFQETHTPETFHFEETGGTMGLAGEMRNLAQEIANSFDVRVARVAALRQETAAKLTQFRQGMKNVQHQLRRKAADLRRFLGGAAASRRRDFGAMHQSIRARQEERNREVASRLAGFRSMLACFQQDHQAAAGHWHNFAATMAKKRASVAR